MNWCDKLASIPGAAIWLETRFTPSDFIFQAQGPLLDHLTEGNQKRFTINHHNTFDVAFTIDDGYQYAFDPSRTAVVFKHRMRAKNVSAGPPIMEMLSQPGPYSELLEVCLTRLREATLRLPDARNRKIEKIAIVSTTVVAEEDLPPGIRRLIDYMGKPWESKLDNYNMSITSTIAETATSTDLCIHAIQKPEQPNELLTITLDYQRVFSPEKTLAPDSLDELLQGLKKDAFRYLEDVAEGNRFDQEIISGAA